MPKKKYKMPFPDLMIEGYKLNGLKEQGLSSTVFVDGKEILFVEELVFKQKGGKAELTLTIDPAKVEINAVPKRRIETENVCGRCLKE